MKKKEKVVLMGKYGITSESQLIDVATIGQGCQQILEGASYLETAASDLESVAGMCSEDVLSVDGVTLEGNVETASGQASSAASAPEPSADRSFR